MTHAPGDSGGSSTAWRTRDVIWSHAESVLGPCAVVTDEPRAGSHVLAVLDAHRHRWFVKHVPDERAWQAEVLALDEWAPAIRDHAPRLHHVDHDRHMMTLTEVPGQTPRPLDPRVHRRAGRLLRRLHRAATPVPASVTSSGHRNRLLQSVSALLASDDRTLLTEAEAAFVEAEIARRNDLPAQSLVACHGDYRPGNWTQDEQGKLHVLDFGEACLEPWAFDLVRLALGPWWGRPPLVRAFLEGYGQGLANDDRRLVSTQAAVHSVVVMRRAHRLQNFRREALARNRLHALMEGHPGVEV